MADDIGKYISNMENMSVEELGGSLLDRQAQINRQREKDAKKQQKIQNALGLLGIGLSITKEAAKRRSAELDEIKAFERGNDETQAEQFNIHGKAINNFLNLDNSGIWDTEEYKEFAANPENFIDFYGDDDNYDFNNLDEGRKRGLYLYNTGRLDTISNQFRPAFDEALKDRMSPARYEALVADNRDYENLLGYHALDIANHYYKDVSEEGQDYKPKYETFIDRGIELFSLGRGDMDAQEALAIAMGLDPDKLGRIERDYIDFYFQEHHNKGLIGGVIDGAKKLGWGSDESPNVFESVSRDKDFYFHRDALDGGFEMNISPIIYNSVDNRLVQFDNFTLPNMNKDSALNVELRTEGENGEHTQWTLAMSDDYENNGLTSGNDWSYKMLYGNRTGQEIVDSALVYIGIPMYNGENQAHGDEYTGQTFTTWAPRKWRHLYGLQADYYDDLTQSELISFHEDVTKLAIYAKENPERFRTIYGNMVGDLDGFERFDKKAMAEYDKFITTPKGRIVVAKQMLQRVGFYSSGNIPAEEYKTTDDLLSRFDKYAVSRGYNTHSSLKAVANNNYIYVDEDGWHYNDDVDNNGQGGWDELTPSAQTEIWHNTFMSIGNLPIEDTNDLLTVYDDFFNDLPHPILGQLTVEKYERVLSNPAMRKMVFGRAPSAPTNVPKDKWTPAMQKKLETDWWNLPVMQKGIEVLKTLPIQEKGFWGDYDKYEEYGIFGGSGELRETSLRDAESRDTYLERIEAIRRYDEIHTSTSRMRDALNKLTERNKNIEFKDFPEHSQEWIQAFRGENSDTVFGVGIEDSVLFDDDTENHLLNQTDIRLNNLFQNANLDTIDFTTEESAIKTNTLLGFIGSAESRGQDNPIFAENSESSASGAFQFTNEHTVTAINRIVREADKAGYELPEDIVNASNLIKKDNLKELDIRKHLSPSSQTLLTLSNLIEHGTDVKGEGTNLLHQYYSSEPGSMEEWRAAEQLYRRIHHTESGNNTVLRNMQRTANITKNLERYYPEYLSFQTSRFNIRTQP